METQIGKTKDVGFQFGIRRTISVSSEKVWDFLFSKKGLKIWLGNFNDELELKKELKTQDGITFFVRVFKPNSHIRLNWKPETWGNISTLQIRIIRNNEKTTIAIHQEKLLNDEQRNEMKSYWTKIIEQLRSELE